MEKWRTKTLGEACLIRPPKREVKRKLAGQDAVSFVPMESLGIRKKTFDTSRTRQLDKVYGSYTYFADGDVLLAKITPCFQNGKLGIAHGLANGVGFGSSEFFVFRCSDQLSPEFLFYFLSQENFADEGVARMSGAVGHQRVPLEFIEHYPIPLPSLPEQERIVAILDEVFAAIATATANAEKNLANARELFESELNAVFTQKGEGWVVKSLGSICDLENGDRGKNYPKRAEYVEAGIPWINTGHILPQGTLSEDSMNFISQEKYDSLRSGKIQSGDLVYCLRGATLGKTAFVDPYSEGAVASSLVILRPSPSLDRDFLFYFLTSPLGQGLIKLYDNGAAQPNLGAKSVAKYTIPLPSVPQQQAIAKNLGTLSEETKNLESICQQKYSALAELKQSILHKAFTGELTADLNQLEPDLP